MKKSRFYTLLLAIIIAANTQAQITPKSQMEKLDRGLVAIPASNTSNFISWRLLGTDNKEATTFDLLRDGEVIASDLKVTNYTDTKGTATSRYEVVTKVNGTAEETSEVVIPWGQKYLSLKLKRPEGGIHETWGDGKNRSQTKNAPYAYYPNDMSVGDVDGDGKYELFLKWESTHAQDNSYNCGYTGNTYIDCYKIDTDKEENCELLWRIDLGKNIRDGAHYTQFMVYDFDGDGKAEMMCKTATGSIDGTGVYVNQAATDATIKGHPNDQDYRNAEGHIKSGPEYLTIFDGQTGKAIHTTWYLPGRAGTGDNGNTQEYGTELGKVSSYPSSSFWGDSYGGRSERFLAAVAYVNGADKNACGIFCRGYYTKAYVWAVSFDGTRLHTEWLHASYDPKKWIIFDQKEDKYLKYEVDGETLYRHVSSTAPANTSGIPQNSSFSQGSNTLYANGNHNLSIADVDGDGCDEILWGAAALNNDGSLLYATGYGHGDAMHVAKMIPDSTDFYVFSVHEEKLDAKYGSWDLHNAKTGRIIQHGTTGNTDNGRGMAAALMSNQRGYQFWSSDERNPRSATTGQTAISKSCSVNFRIYWDGDPQDELFDGSYKYDSNLGIDANWAQSSHAEPAIEKWGGSSFSKPVSFYSSTYNNAQTCNYTKSTPCLQADFLGDWREELIMWNKKDSAEVMIFTTWTPTTHAVPTLMHDHTYRMAIAWQNTAYNQPPHLGYYLPDYIDGRITGVVSVATEPQEAIETVYDLQGRQHSGLKRGLNIVRIKEADGTTTTKKIIIK